MQDPQRPRRASTQALGVMTTPERRNSFEEAQPEAQVSSKRQHALSWSTIDLDQALHISSPRPRRLAPSRAIHGRRLSYVTLPEHGTGVLRAPPTHTGDDEKERQGGELQRAS